MTRYEQPLEIPLTREQTSHLADNGRSTDRRQLTVRYYGETLTARWPARTGFDNPPMFTGRVQPRDDGAAVVGSIRESSANALWSRIMQLVVVLMAGLAVFGAVLLITNGARYGLAPLLIGVLATPVTALLWRRLRRQRRPTFDADAEQLRLGLTRYLTSGDGARRGPG